MPDLIWHPLMESQKVIPGLTRNPVLCKPLESMDSGIRQNDEKASDSDFLRNHLPLNSVKKWIPARVPK